MKPIVTMDFETDPFKHGFRVEPFACGIFDGKNFWSCWSRDCAARAVRYLQKLPPSIIYLHNGGRFDIFYLLEWLNAEMTIINGRIVKAWLGKHEVRDSYAILPIALAQYKKDDIEISKLEAGVRDTHRVEILSYLRGDCVYLYELVTAFLDEFGDYLTIGSAAMEQLKRFHPFHRVVHSFVDDKFRSTFFFGGRVQCFRGRGVYNIPFKIYDVNSMYPHVMKNFLHPNGTSSNLGRSITRKTAFVVAEGHNDGAFPLRTRKGIDFTMGLGTYACSIHEWKAAVETKQFKHSRVIKTYDFDEWISFGEFVDHFFNARQRAKKIHDKIRDIFYKLILNSAYGKFAQNPHNFFDYAITHRQRMASDSGWSEHFIHNGGQYVIWKKPVQRHSYYNVCIGASITGAARATLLTALAKADAPIYCDTDSIISRDLSCVPFSDTELGAWKLEGMGNRISIAGKKLYACYDGDRCIKSATKGARISPPEIDRVASGETVTFRKDAPTFKLDGRVEFIARRIKATV